jgi:WD40 repeat protein
VAVTAVAGAVLCDVEGKAEPQTLSRHALQDSAVAFGVDAVAVCTADNAVEIRDARSGQTRHVLRGHQGLVTALAFSQDGGLLATAARDRTIRLWDAATGKPRFALESAESVQSPEWLLFEPRGHYLISGGQLGTFKHSLLSVWDLRAKAAVATLVPCDVPCAGFLADGSGFLRGTQKGAVLLATVAEIEEACAAAKARSQEVARVDQTSVLDKITVVPGGQVGVWGVAASPDGRWVATASHDSTVKLWDARTLKLVRTLMGHEGVVWCVAFSPDSKYLASGGGGVKVWEADTGREVQHIEEHSRLVSSLAFHPGGRWLASADLSGEVRLRDVAAGASLGLLHKFDGPVHSLAFHPGGGWLGAACHDQGIALWRFGDAPPVPADPDRILTGHTAAVRSVGFSADGRYLASGSEQGTIILWDGESFSRVVTLKGGTGQVRGLSFSRDGQYLAGAAYVSPTIVWDLTAVRRTLREMKLDW